MSDEKISELEKAVDCSRCFTKDQKETLIDMIRVYKGWKFLVNVVKGSAVAAGLLAGFIVAFGSIQETIKSWLS